MRRNRQPSLRGSVNQNSTPVRVRARATSRLTFLIRCGIAGSLVVTLILLGIWSWRSGWLHQQASHLTDSGLRVTQKAHFAIGDIIVEGRQHTDKDQLSTTLGAAIGSPILAFDPEQAAVRITKMPWVASVIVERRLPDVIYVRLTEREPLARWQHDNHTVVIDLQGKILADTNADQFGQLPLMVGVGAPTETKTLLDQLHEFPVVEQQMTAAVRVSERRWDLHLQPKVIARLPESDIPDALKRLSILITEQKVLERDIVAIDLRLPDRVIIEPNTASPAQHPANGDNRL